MNPYVEGNIPELTATYVTDQGINYDPPGGVSFSYQVTFGGIVVTSATIVYGSATVPAPGIIAKTGVGVYVVQLATKSHPGYWLCEWFANGVSDPTSFLVYPSPLPIPY
jgi:hypothetical protein